MTMQILPPRLSGNEVILDGFKVPRVEVKEIPETGQWEFVYDRRYSTIAENIDELQRWLWIVATAQAVGEGYSCHGENSVYRPNPHKVKVMCIGSSEKPDAEED